MSDEIPSRSVVGDANVWISAFITEDANHLRSRHWLDQWLRSKHKIVGPSLVSVEIAGAMARRTGDSVAPRRAIDDLRRLPSLVLRPLDDTLISAAADLAATLHLRGADAIYVALAQRLALPLVTWDRELLDRATRVIDVRTPPTP